MTNASNVIFPDKDNGVWVFDDPNDGLPRKLFVEGPDRMIHRAVADIPNAASGAIGIDRSNPALSLPGTCGASLHLEQALARRPGSMGHSSNFYRRVRRFGADPQ